MKWTAYLRDQCLPIVVWALAIGFVVMMLGTLGVNASARVFLAIVLAAAGVVCLLYGYFRRAGFYRDLKDRMESLDQKYLITEMIERPEFLEGKLLYDLLNQVDKSMNDKLGEYRRSSSEYREYIETVSYTHLDVYKRQRWPGLFPVDEDFPSGRHQKAAGQLDQGGFTAAVWSQ